MYSKYSIRPLFPVRIGNSEAQFLRASLFTTYISRVNFHILSTGQLAVAALIGERFARVFCMTSKAVCEPWNHTSTKAKLNETLPNPDRFRKVPGNINKIDRQKFIDIDHKLRDFISNQGFVLNRVQDRERLLGRSSTCQLNLPMSFQ